MITPEIATTVAVAMFASTGFWTLVNNIYQDKKKPKGGLYITDMTLSKFRDTDLETKSTLLTTNNQRTYSSTRNKNRKHR